MRAHVGILGWLFMLFGLLALALGGVLLYAIYVGFPGQPDPQVEGARDLLRVLGWFCAVDGAVYLGVGFGLTQYWSSARYAAIALSILGLVLTPPLGTVFGVYALWVLCSSAGVIAYEGQRVYLGGLDERPVIDAPPSNGTCCGLLLLSLLLAAAVTSLHHRFGADIARATGLEGFVRGLLPAQEGAEGGGGAADPQAPRRPPPQPVESLPGYWSYTDERGTKHIVEGYDAIPPEYREDYQGR